MALARTVSSPINLFGPTYATYDHLYNESKTHVVKKVLVTPFVPLLTVPSGAFAMTVDVVAGPLEMITFSHFSNAAYPWESYEYRVAEVWNKMTPILLVSVATAGAGAAMVADAMNGGGGSSYSSGYSPPVQAYQSAGVDSGVAAAASTVTQNHTAPAASKPQTDIYTRNCSKHGEYDSRFSLGGCPACKAPKFAE